MLDKKEINVLLAIEKLCDGKFQILEASEILSQIENTSMDNNELYNIINKLVSEKLVSLKYYKDNEYFIALTDDGDEKANKIKKANEEKAIFEEKIRQEALELEQKRIESERLEREHIEKERERLNAQKQANQANNASWFFKLKQKVTKDNAKSNLENNKITQDTYLDSENDDKINNFGEALENNQIKESNSAILDKDIDNTSIATSQNQLVKVDDREYYPIQKRQFVFKKSVISVVSGFFGGVIGSVITTLIYWLITK